MFLVTWMSYATDNCKSVCVCVLAPGRGPAGSRDRAVSVVSSPRGPLSSHAQISGGLAAGPQLCKALPHLAGRPGDCTCKLGPFVHVCVCACVHFCSERGFCFRSGGFDLPSTGKELTTKNN